MRYSEEEGGEGCRGGAALDLTIAGNLYLYTNARMLAEGVNAGRLIGGAGSGGSVHVAWQGKLSLVRSDQPYFSAQGGKPSNAEKGRGGEGISPSTLVVNSPFPRTNER